MMNDPELQEIFTDPGHQEVVDLLKASRPATPPLDPHFRSYLRAKLMTEARQTLPRSASRPWYAFSFKRRTLALSMGAVAAGFLVVLGVQVYLRTSAVQPGPAVAVVVPISNKTDVATTAEPIELNFSGPVDKNAVAESVQIEPATAVTKTWVGSTLIITPTHPLAPNTTYTVRLQPSAGPAASASPLVRPTPTVAATPLVVHFSTVRAIPPVTPPSYKSSNVTYGHDNRLDKSGTILNAIWTGAGQLIATRPAGQGGPAGLATPSGSASPSGSPAASTDVWLMSSSGTPIRNLAPGAMLPSAPASGSLFAAWTLRGGQASLDVRDLQGTLIATVAIVNGTPKRPAVWLGSDRLAYVDNGVLKLVDLHAMPVPLPSTIKVDRGSVEGSPNGTLLAVETVDSGSIVVDLSASPAFSSPLQQGATGFAWSPKGELAFVVQRASTTGLYVAADGKHAGMVAASPSGQMWSDLNWAPDASSLLLASRPDDSSAGNPNLLVIDRDGSSPRPFGTPRVEYSAPEWSPSGDLVLFTRRDDATGGITFQVATLSISGSNAAEHQAIAEVDKFMKARLAADNAAAQGELDAKGLAAYQSGNASLLSAAGTSFARYSVVTVQLTATNPNQFLIGVRTFISKAKQETGFFEEQLTVIQQDQRYLIHDVQAAAVQPLSHGPSVVSVEVLQTPPGQRVKVQFDADLKAETVTRATIQIKDQDGNPVEATVTFDADTHLAILAVKLRQGTYQLVVTTGVTDFTGVPLTQEYDAPLVISR